MNFILISIIFFPILTYITSQSTTSTTTPIPIVIIPVTATQSCQNNYRNFFNTASNFRDDLQSCTPDLTVVSSDIYTYVDQFTQNYDEFRSDYDELQNCGGFVCQDRLISQMQRYVEIMSYDLETISNEIGQATPGLDPGTAYCLESVVNNVNNSLLFNLNC